MNVVRALVGIHRLQVRHVPEDLIVLVSAVAAMHVACGPSKIQRLAAVVAIDKADHLGRSRALVHPSTNAQSCLKTKRDLRVHVGKLFLEQLRTGDRLSELLAIEAVLTRA